VPTERPWLNPQEAAAYAGVSSALIYREVRAGRLKAAYLGGRRQIRIHRTWIDAWLEADVSVDVINPQAPGAAVPAPVSPFRRKGHA
jgi:excisionase family DNA binding protein